jgi:hypothetical protein
LGAYGRGGESAGAILLAASSAAAAGVAARARDAARWSSMSHEFITALSRIATTATKFQYSAAV